MKRNPRSEHRIRVRVHGMVQGVGFRPFAANLADRLKLSGWVMNDADGVTLEAQGISENIDTFVQQLRHELPPPAAIDRLQVISIPAQDTDSPPATGTFRIIDSVAHRGGGTAVTPDLAVCAACLSELNDPNDRRFRYPFINCSHCGPRFTIQRDLPYDRVRTTMDEFTMCNTCRQEYEDPNDRRFHAQPNACPACGPRIWLAVGEHPTLTPPTHRETDDALRSFAVVISKGGIVAVKGIGGFHLACDATDPRAVDRLRKRKGRDAKPFAVMVRELRDVEAFAHTDRQAQAVLDDRSAPIVLLKKREPTRHTAMLDAVAPCSHNIGEMLAYSPLHHLLLKAVDRPLVMTSGNLADEPIARTNREAANRLAGIADAFLFHDRVIETPCDDSVVAIGGNHQVLPIRRSRGQAPRPIGLASSGPCVLAIGGDLKGTFCLTEKRQAIISQHLGDAGNPATLQSIDQTVRHFLRLFRIRPVAVAADLHPGYVSRLWAERFASERNLPLIGVQHHVAHAGSLVAELGEPIDGRLLVCCFDGTGYGSDGHVWGGEFFLTDGRRFDRVGHLTEFLLPGGDACIRRPYRTALAVLKHCGVEWTQDLPPVATCPADEFGVLRQQLDRGFGSTPTSSFGRLFDAIASIIGVRHRVSYEAQAAIELETLARQSVAGPVSWSHPTDATRYHFDVLNESPFRVDFETLVHRIVDDLSAGVDRRSIAAGFHQAVARLIRDIGCLLRDHTQLKTIGLSGGVFQNMMLNELTVRTLRDAGFQVARHRRVPPNDGGLALGQAYLARQRLQNNDH